MAEWTQEDADEFLVLNDLGFENRSVQQELRFRILVSKHKNAKRQKQANFEKKGMLYKPAIISLLLGLGSCTGGILAATDDLYDGLPFVGIGIGLVVISSIFNGINSWMMRGY